MNLFGNIWLEIISLEETALMLEDYCVIRASRKVYTNPDRDLKEIVQQFYNKVDISGEFKGFFAQYSLGTLQTMKNRLKVLWNIKEINKGEWAVFSVKVQII